MNTAVNNVVRRLLAASMILGGASLFGEEAEFVPYTGQTADGNYLISDANGLAMLAENIRNSAPGKSEALAVYSQSTSRRGAPIGFGFQTVKEGMT